VGEIKTTCEIFLRNFNEKVHVEDLCVNLRMISKRMLKDQNMKAEFEFN
jgi:hypothetical protein